jgi:diguanylate cyclase (GGDEF)-like protein
LAAAWVKRLTPFFPSPFITAVIPLTYFGGALLASHFARQTGDIVTLWVSSAILLVALIRNRVATWPLLTFLCMIADVGSWLLMIGGFSPLTIGSAVGNPMEALLVAATMHRFGDKKTWFFSIRWMILFAGAVILAVALVTGTFTAALVAGVDSHHVPDAPFVAIWFRLAATDVLSMILVSPLLLCWTEPALRRGLTPSRLLVALILVCLVAGVSYFTFTGGLPLLFLVFPFLAILTLRAGLPGATAGAVTLTAVAAWYTTHGIGPIAELPNLGMGARILILQLYFFTAILSTIPIAVILTLREVLSEKLRQQGSISNAALNNMAQGLCMFDDRQQLITCNQRYADMYKLPDDLRMPGTPLRAILEYRRAVENLEGVEEQPIADGEEAGVLNAFKEVHLSDGRIIDIHRRPLANGGWVATHEDVTEQRHAARRIAHLANHDPLTDLPNRAFFQKQLQTSISVAEGGHGFALHFLDLDRFKQVNDTLGHGVGDELLKQVAGRLRAVTRNTDLVTRLGGDEFAIVQVLMEKPEEAGMLAARLVQTLSEPYRIADQDVSIGASIGIALAPGDATDSAELLRKSDLALYRAKGEGRGTYRFFEKGMDSLLHEQRTLTADLATAIRNGEFEVHYQPLLDCRTGRISSFEALLRWHHPRLGLVPPLDFIPIAEETGLIVQIGEWVARQACREAAAWPDDLKVAVNLSPVQFKNSELIATIADALASAGLAPERLELEMTESVLLQDSEAVLGVLQGLRALGVGLALDDFGTGYSSLSYLRSFPFDRVKIDKSFVSDLTRPDCLAIVEATIALSAKLGMTATAEGVETAEQLAILQAAGCSTVQGYYISEPLPADRVEEILRAFPAPGPVADHEADLERWGTKGRPTAGISGGG